MAIVEGLRIFHHDGLEGPFPGTLLPDAPDSFHGQMQRLVFGNSQCLSHHLTAGDATSLRLYANPAQDFNGELNIEVTQVFRQRDGALGRDRFFEGTLQATAVNLLPPLGESLGDGLSPPIELIPYEFESAEVDRAGLRELDVILQHGTGACA